MVPEPREFPLSSLDLTDWIDRQDPDNWWMLMHEPFLSKRLHAYCSGPVLSAKLRKADSGLFLLDYRREQPDQEVLGPDDLDRFVKFRARHAEKTLWFRWASQSPEQRWQLIEEKEWPSFLRSTKSFQVLERGGAF